MSHVNVEIKAKASNQDSIRDILKSLNADYKGTDTQIDTYFNVEYGRLKLRQGNIENNLIHYERENDRGPKQSNVTLYKSCPDSSLKDVLLNSLDVLVVVHKTREIYFIDNVKFHLDNVSSLGSFVEIEAIDFSNMIGLKKLHEQCNHYIQLFNISEQDMVSCSYCDLLLEYINNPFAEQLKIKAIENPKLV
jgi:adenylate cyclase class 2